MDVSFSAFHTVAELLKIHGEPLSAELVKALPHGETTGHGGQLSDLGGQLYFYFDGWLDDGSEDGVWIPGLWTSDGTEEGTKPVKKFPSVYNLPDLRKQTFEKTA